MPATVYGGIDTYILYKTLSDRRGLCDLFYYYTE
jgi:hypothetical protein